MGVASWNTCVPHRYSLWLVFVLVLLVAFICLNLNQYVDQSRNSPVTVESGLKKRLPNAVLIGVKKGGTRALIEMLDLHPRVRSSGKEVHFFDKNANYNLGLEWYREQMRASAPGDIVIEKSPAYFVVPEVPARILRDLGKNVKLLLVLRNPVDRIVSDFMQGQHRRRGEMVRVDKISPKELRGMQDMLARKVHLRDGSINPKANYITVGMYAQHLKRWLEHFSLDQIFITSTDELVAIPNVVLKEAGKFLGMEDFDWDSRIVRVNDFKLACLNRTTGTSNIPTPVCLNGSKGREHIPISRAFRQQVFDYYKPHNEELFQLIGKTFEVWRHPEVLTRKQIRDHFRAKQRGKDSASSTLKHKPSGVASSDADANVNGAEHETLWFDEEPL